MQIIKAPVTPEDELFLFDLYASARHEEMSLVAWNEEQKRAFLLQQFQAQHNYYTAKFPSADFLILTIDGEKIGRLYTAELDDELRILDLTIKPEQRGQGIGSQLIAEIVSHAEANKQSVQIYLETMNRAASLFTRFGFKPISGDDVYQLWQLTFDADNSGRSLTAPEANQAAA